MRHPESSLAAFIEGRATSRERATVERHLEACQSCRAEIEHARAARSALGSLPELHSPGVDLRFLAAGGTAVSEPVTAEPTATGPVTAETRRMEPVGTAPPAVAPGGTVPEEAAGPGGTIPEEAAGPVAPPTPPTPIEAGRRRLSMRTLQAVLGAAAIVVAVGLFIGLERADRPGGRAASIPAPGAEDAGRDFESVRTDHDRQSLDRLARRLAREAGQQQTLQAARREPALDVAAPEASGETRRVRGARRDQARALECLQRGTRLVDGTRLQFLVEGTYEGREAYIGAFLARVKSREPTLLVLAVSRDGCERLRVIRRSL